MILKFYMEHFERKMRTNEKPANLICKHTCNSSAILQYRLHAPTINVEEKLN